MIQQLKKFTLALVLFSTFPSFGYTYNKANTVNILPKTEIKQINFTITLCPNFPICKKEDKRQESKKKTSKSKK